MKEEDNNNTERTSKSVYIAIPAEDYEKLSKAAKANCRSIGGELLYGWKRNYERESGK